MYIRYLAIGRRNYRHAWAGRSHVHDTWELSVAVSGRIAPVVRGFDLPPQGRRLWAIPPGLAHGWTGDGRAAEVVVVCPRWVPEALRHATDLAVRERHLPSLDFTPAEAAAHRALAAGLLAQPPTAGPLNILEQELAVSALCLRLLRTCPRRWLRGLDDGRRAVVDAACAWFAEHLAEGPDEAAVAQAVHVSPAHLRRLFHVTLGEPPRRAFVRLRLARADALLQSTAWSLERIAVECGLAGGAVSLCRLYRRVRGESPAQQRDAAQVVREDRA